MNRKLLLVILGLVALAGLVGGCAGASAQPAVGANPIVYNNQQSTGIWVSGEGIVTVVPDLAILSLGVEAQAPTVAEAQQEAAAAMEAVLKSLEQNGVAKKDIKTQYYSIYPLRRWEDNKEILIGYQVTNTVTAKIRKVDQTGTIIDEAAKAGGDNIRISGITFTVENTSAYLDEARSKAMAEAKKKADQLANLAGVKLGKPVYITESGGYTPIYRDYYDKGAVPAPSVPTTPITLGETEVRLSVQVVYSIT